jgi:hypothetical protein
MLDSLLELESALDVESASDVTKQKGMRQMLVALQNIPHHLWTAGHGF